MFGGVLYVVFLCFRYGYGVSSFIERGREFIRRAGLVRY